MINDTSVTEKKIDYTIIVCFHLVEVVLRILKSCVTFIVGIFLITGGVVAQDNVGRRQFYDIVELSKLIEKAREAGFTDEQIARLQLRDSGDSIDVEKYMNEIRQKKIMRDRKLKEFLSKKFLTIQDIYKELVTLEPDVLNKLREELVSER